MTSKKVLVNKLIERVKLALGPDVLDWVLFSNGTVVVFKNPNKDGNLEDKAISLMKEFGPGFPGTSAGDMRIIELARVDGWIVLGHGPSLGTYVHPEELDVSKPDHILVGVHGRSKRDKDSKELRIVHVNRKTT